ncbi:MAG: tyrosine-type recombinase/integrase [Methylovulum sp.]|nr:tyrosine-type recombinase/integrase [Methylovulum sp.]
MPRPTKGARLYKRVRAGREPVWLIVDGRKEIVAAHGEGGRGEAEKALGAYLAEKHKPIRDRDPDQTPLASILTFYAERRAGELRRPDLIGYAMASLLNFWGDAMAGAVKASTCRDYATWRTAQPRPHFKDAENAPRIAAGTARRELAVLTAALNFAFEEGVIVRPVPVVLPPPPPARERHLSRSEVAALLWGALGFQRGPDGALTRHKHGAARHLCRFILIGVYTATRHDAILRLRWLPSTDSGWIDLERKKIYRAGSGERQTKKRRPPLPIPDALLPHLRRWRAMGSASGYVIEFDGHPIGPLRTAWERARARAGLSSDVTPHVMKHTCITWLLQAGVPIWTVAGYAGTTEKVIREVYGHHAPDYLEEAARRL